jgi:hypothetical protein
MEQQIYFKRVGHFFESFIETMEERERMQKKVIIDNEKKYRNILNLFFEVLSYKTEVFRQIKTESDKKLSSGYSTFHFINTDELMLSRLLALCLNPTGSHGQSANFLNEFLKFFNLDVEIPKNKKKIRVLREYPTDKGRFIDIVVEVNSKAIIGIENKPFAEELHDQAGDYVTFLESKIKDKSFENYYFIFLQKSGNKPISIEIEKRNRLEEKEKLHTLSYYPDMKNLLSVHPR